MSALAATTIAALLIVSPSTTDADRIAANGGFLIGNAHRCGVAPERVERSGKLVRTLIAGAAEDNAAEEAAATRFTIFLLASAFADSKTEKMLASCKAVSAELARLERHHATLAAPDGGGETPRATAPAAREEARRLSPAGASHRTASPNPRR